MPATVSKIIQTVSPRRNTAAGVSWAKGKTTRTVEPSTLTKGVTGSAATAASGLSAAIRRFGVAPLARLARRRPPASALPA